MENNVKMIRFGVFELDLAARQLRKNGTRIKLQDQPFRVLQLLLERPGEVVTREDLKEKLWSEDTFVEFDHSLNTSVQKIRQALRDSAEAPRFIETVPRVGYRFVAPVDQSTEPGTGTNGGNALDEIESPGPAWRGTLPWLLAGALALALAWNVFVGPRQPEQARHVRRFTIVPQVAGAGVYSRASARGWPAAAAISPDGSRIAYFSTENPSRLWLHDLSTGESNPLDGTESDAFRQRIYGVSVFWSPNGDALGFFTGNSLNKVNLRDGSVTVLHTLGGSGNRYGGGTWSLDGETIAFSTGTGGGSRLFAVPASGGDTRPLLAGREIGGNNPTFLPSKDPALVMQRFSGLHLLRLSSGETSLLVEDGRRAVWSPTGHLIFDKEGSLWALPYSLQNLEPTGEAFLIEPGFASGGVSQDGTLLSVTARLTGDRFQLAIRNRQGEMLGVIGPPLFGRVGPTNPAVNPDGTKVALSASPQQGALNDLWVFDVDGGGSLRLTTDPGWEDGPVWTRDGKRILFRSGGDIGSDADFFIVDALGGGRVEAVLDNDHRVAEPALSPDGSTLIFQQRPLEPSQFDLFFTKFPRPGDQVDPIAWLDSPFSEVHPQFSRDGRYVAYSSTESGTSQIHIRPFPKGSPVWQVSLEGGTQPRWSRNGDELYWFSLTEGFPIMAAKIDFSRSNPVGEREVLFPTERNVGTFIYDVMPDGRFVILEPIQEDDSQPPPPIHFRITQNWAAEFKDRKGDVQ